MIFGILYVPEAGPFAGLEIALWKDYGVPFCFSTVPHANEFIRRNPWLSKHEGHAMAWRHIMRTTACMVEVFSGRRQLIAGRMQTTIDSRPTYEHIMSKLPHCQGLLMTE